jgi:threonine dehydratase
VIATSEVEARGPPGRRTDPADPVLSAGPTLLKLEFLQHAGSFKTSGMLNQILAAAEHGLPAVGHRGLRRQRGPRGGVRGPRAGRAAEIYVPVNAPPVKVAKLTSSAPG